MGKKVTLHEEIRDIQECEGNRWMNVATGHFMTPSVSLVHRIPKKTSVAAP